VLAREPADLELQRFQLLAVAIRHDLHVRDRLAVSCRAIGAAPGPWAARRGGARDYLGFLSRTLPLAFFTSFLSAFRNDFISEAFFGPLTLIWAV
jgi:hypothetical protein